MMRAIAKRTVAETATAGQLVGDPVTAEDGDAADVLTYTLVAESNGADDNFVIDRATGQISVAKGAKFNVEADDNISGQSSLATATLSPSLPQTLRAYQPKSETDQPNALFRDTVEVTITVTAVDEPPIFTVTGDTSSEFRGKFTNEVVRLRPCRSNGRCR